MKKIILLSIVLIFTISIRAEILFTDDPTGYTATTISDVQIDLNWSLNLVSDSILLVVNSTNTFGIHTDSNAYLPCDVFVGGGIVIYKGIGASFSHLSLMQNITYYDKIFSFASGWIYSFGVTANANTLFTTMVPTISEGFENGGADPSC